MIKKPNGKRGENSQDRTRAGNGAEGAFDLWIEDKLRNAYSSVLDEPIPEDLIRLLQQKLNQE